MNEFDRREVLNMTLAAFLELVLALPSMAERARAANKFQGVQRSAEPLNWQAFLEELGRAAEAQFERNWNQRRYVRDVANLSARLANTVDPQLSDLLVRYRTGGHRGPAFADLYKTHSVQVNLISFERGDYIPHHDHPAMTGVMTCAVGGLSVASYDLVQDRPGSADCLLRRIDETMLLPGQVSTLTARVNNIHRVQASVFSQVIDVFTPPYDETRTRKTRWFRVAMLPLREGSDVFLAHQYQ